MAQLALGFDAGTQVKGCALGALLSLLGLIVGVVFIGGVLHLWFGISPTATAPAAIVGGILLWVSANLLKAAIKAWRERSALTAALAGAVPADGRPTILSGHIEPLGTALRAPLSGRECVAYSFEIYAFFGTGRHHRRVVLCDGLAISPSTIVTRSGAFRLLAVPELECEESPLNPSESMARASEIMRSTPYEPPAKPFTRPSIEKQWSDDDGEFRRQRRHVEDDMDTAEWRLSERALERGAPVCVFGQYSAAKRGIVADPQDWSKVTRVMKGNAESIVQQLDASIRRRMMGALAAAALVVGVVAALLSNR